MGKKRSGHAVRDPSRLVFPLGEFLARLHQCIGGSGPVNTGSATECPAFRRDHPDHELEVGDFRTEYLWAHIMRKYDDGVKSSHKRDKALASMLEAEKQCATTPNRVARARRNGSDYPALSQVGTIDAVMHTASRKIAAVLGDFKWVDTLDYVGFGPGATTNLPRRQADLWYKFGSLPEASSTCVPLVVCYLGRCAPLWKRHLIQQWGVTYSITDANRVTTVPKNYETDRPIAIEPQWNMFFQKGIGGLIRSRLRKVGVDLNDQTINRKRAFAGSNEHLGIEPQVATLDLSSASDTVSRWLVHELLPPEWVAAMERCRSSHSVLPSGERILLRKFSSMGNGYTFELESLIFWAISSTVVQMVRKDSRLKDHRVSVYGDDIIVPSDCYDALCEALDVLGFIPNREKSFAKGPFRESCGMHAFKGHDVTPFYIREPITSLDRLFLLHNNLVRWSMQRYPGVRDARVRELCRWVRSFAPNEWRKPRLPDGYGDGAFIGSFDEVRPHINPYFEGHESLRKRGLAGFRTTVWVEKPITFNSERAKKRARLGKGTVFENEARLLRTLWNLRDVTLAQLARASTTSELIGKVKVADKELAVRCSELRSDTSHDVSVSTGAFGKSRVYVWMWTEIGPWIDFQDDTPEQANFWRENRQSGWLTAS